MDQWTNGPIDQWTRNSCDPMKRKTPWNVGHWKIGTFEHSTFDIQLAPVCFMPPLRAPVGANKHCLYSRLSHPKNCVYRIHMPWSVGGNQNQKPCKYVSKKPFSG